MRATGAASGPGRASVDILALASGNYAAIGLSLVISVVLTRQLGPTEFGKLALMIAAAQLLSFFASVWTLTAVVHFGAREFAATGRISGVFWTRSALVAPWIVAAGAAFALARGPIASYLEIPPDLAWLVIAYFLLLVLTSTGSVALQAIQRARRYAAALLLERALIAVLLVATLAFRPLDGVSSLVIFAVGALGAALFMFGSIGRLPLSFVVPTMTDLRAMWGFSLPLIASTWLGFFGTQWLDYAVIRRFLSFEELGRYSLAHQLAGVLQQVSIAVATVLLPRYSVLVEAGRADEIRRMLVREIPYWLFGLSIALGVALLILPTATALVFGPSFAGASEPLSLLVVATMELAIFNTFTPILTAHAVLWPMSAIVLISVTANVLLNLALVPILGIEGAAIATVVAYAASAGLVLAVSRSRLGLPTLRFALFVLPVLAVYLSMLAPVAFRSILAPLALVASAGLVARSFGLGGRADLLRLRTVASRIQSHLK